MWGGKKRLVRPLLPLAVCALSSGWVETEERRGSVACNDSSRACHVERRDGHTVVFRDKEEFMRKRSAFIEDGPGRLQVVSDFDYTMTKCYISPGKRGASCHCLIEDSGFLPSTYQTQAKALFHYYYPKEVSATLTVQEKVPLMLEWVEKAHDLLLLSKLRQSQIKFAVAEALNENTIGLRAGVTDMLKVLQVEQVPILLFSAGLGDVIEEVLKQKCGESILKSVHIVSNHMIFDNDILVGFTSPSYHVFNKKALYAKDTSPYFLTKGLEKRHNLLLLGDSLGDTTMCEGLEIKDESKIKIGFLNVNVERIPDYLDAYDVVLLGDPDFRFVNTLLREIIQGTSASMHQM